jgi:hypothetical protein
MPFHAISVMSTTSTNAIAMLRGGYREVIDWFSEYDSAASNVKKQELASKICRTLRVHMAIQEQIFYPAFLLAIQDPLAYAGAVNDHAATQRLIEQILESSPIDEQFDSQVRLLRDVITQFANEEDCAGGLFAQAQESDMDLELVGLQMRKRQNQLEDDSGRRKLP